MRDSGQSLWHSCRTATAFRSSPRQNRLSLHRVNGESFLGSGCLPSTSASLTRVACAATSTNPPATSLRLCRRTSASGALFSPSPAAFAFGSGRRPSPFFRMGATRSTSRPRPFDPVRAAGGWSVARRLLQSRSSDPGAPPSNRSIPASSISSIDAVFCGPVGVELHGALAHASLLTRWPKPSRKPSIRCRAATTRSGAGLAFAYASGVASFRGLSLPVSPQLHSYPNRDVHKHLVSQNT